MQNRVSICPRVSIKRCPIFVVAFITTGCLAPSLSTDDDGESGSTAQDGGDGFDAENDANADSGAAAETEEQSDSGSESFDAGGLLDGGATSTPLAVILGPAPDGVPNFAGAHGGLTSCTSSGEPVSVRPESVEMGHKLCISIRVNDPELGIVPSYDHPLAVSVLGPFTEEGSGFICPLANGPEPWSRCSPSRNMEMSSPSAFGEWSYCPPPSLGPGVYEAVLDQDGAHIFSAFFCVQKPTVRNVLVRTPVVSVGENIDVAVYGVSPYDSLYLYSMEACENPFPAHHCYVGRVNPPGMMTWEPAVVHELSLSTANLMAGAYVLMPDPTVYLQGGQVTDPWFVQITP